MWTYEDNENSASGENWREPTLTIDNINKKKKNVDSNEETINVNKSCRQYYKINGI